MSLTHAIIASTRWLCLSLLTILPCLAQVPELHRLTLERGPVIGASFDSPHDHLYVEQVAFVPNSPSMELHRKILIFSLSDLKMVGERVVESKSGVTLFMPTCDAVATDASGSSITVCLDDRIAVLRTNDLVTTRSFPLPANMVARGMALDEKRSEVIVLLGPGHLTSSESTADIDLAVYDWRTGANKSTRTVATVSMVNTAILAFDQVNGSIAVGIVNNAGGSRVTELFSCIHKDAVLCSEKATVGPIESMTIMGSKLLLGADVNSGVQRCIPEMDLHTGAISQEFCGAQYPIKNAIAVAFGGYALAFTGTSRYNPFSEHTANVQSSLSLWCGDRTNSPVKISYPVNKDLGQGLVRIVGDSAAAEFVTFTKQDNSVLAVLKLRSVPKAFGPQTMVRCRQTGDHVRPD